MEAELGPVSILVNNAGIASRGLAVADTTAEELARVMGTHAFAAHALSKRVVPAMRGQDRGDIIMISSRSDSRPGGQRRASHNMAKAALEALAMTLAKEERAHGIRVNVVAPGLVDTDMGRRLVAATQGGERAHSRRHHAFGRVCQPEDVANVVRFLVSPDNSYLTGERIYCDGGGPLAGRRVAE